MKCFVVFQSIKSWQKLSGIPMRPKSALAVLRYTKLVEAEYNHIEKLRVALAYEISGAAEGTEVKIDPDTPEAQEFSRRFNEILSQDSSLAPMSGVYLDGIVGALDGKEDSLTVSDLALLEPFFLDSSIDLPKPDGDCSE